MDKKAELKKKFMEKLKRKSEEKTKTEKKPKEKIKPDRKSKEKIKPDKKSKEKIKLGRKSKENIKNKTQSQEQRFKKLTKASLYVIVVGIVMLLVVVLSMCYSLLVSREHTKTVEYLNEYVMASKTLTTEAKSYAVTGNITHYDNYMRELEQDMVREKAWEKLKSRNISAEERETLETINDLTKELLPLEEQTLQLAMDKDLTGAVAVVYGDLYSGIVDRMDSLTDRCISNIGYDAEVKGNISIAFMLVASVAFVILFFYILKNHFNTIKFSEKELLRPIIEVSKEVVALSEGNFAREFDIAYDDTEVGQMIKAIIFMKQNFSNMIMEISDALERMGTGDYQVQLTQEYVGEFIKIKDSMEAIIEETVNTLSTIQNAAEEINIGATHLEQAAEDLATGSSVQTGKVSDMVQLVQNVYSAMERHVEEADITVQFSKHAGDILGESYKKMQSLKLAIANINDCSSKINKIILTIQDIADETNLLSLNASIEAARAGEAGRGFAVVAEEVKKLADASAKASNETTKLIETTNAAVKEGMSITEQAAENMNEVMQAAMETTMKMQNMADLLKAEACNLQDINKDMEEVSLIVDNNAATSEETAAISEEQAAQVAAMVEMLEQFKI